MKTISNRRKRSDSAAAAIAAVQAAALGPIEPPSHVSLRDGDRPFWDAIVKSRARDTWTDSDLAQAATMARAQADVERLQREIDAEGDVIGDKANPKHKLLETISRRAVAISRVIHVHAEATNGRSRNAVKSHQLEKAAPSWIDLDDQLIPTLRAVQ